MGGYVYEYGMVQYKSYIVKRLQVSDSAMPCIKFSLNEMYVWFLLPTYPNSLTLP